MPEAALLGPGAHAPAQALKDPKPYVRDTTAWTVGRIFEFVHDDSGGLITQDNLPGVVAVLMESLKDEPSIAVHVAAAIGYLAGGFSGTPGGATPRLDTAPCAGARCLPAASHVPVLMSLLSAHTTQLPCPPLFCPRTPTPTLLLVPPPPP